MDKRKETVAKIWELLDGLSYYEAKSALECVNKRLEQASFVSLQTYNDRRQPTVPTEFVTVKDEFVEFGSNTRNQ